MAILCKEGPWPPVAHMELRAPALNPNLAEAKTPWPPVAVMELRALALNPNLAEVATASFSDWEISNPTDAQLDQQTALGRHPFRFSLELHGPSYPMMGCAYTLGSHLAPCGANGVAQSTPQNTAQCKAQRF